MLSPISTRATRATPRTSVRSAFLLVFVLLVPRTAAVAQGVDIPAPGDSIYSVRLVDGSTFFGRVISVQGDLVSITTISGVPMSLGRAQIRDISAARGRLVEGEFWHEDPNTTRLFFTSTGRSLKAGEGYMGTYLLVLPVVLVLPFVAVGLSDDLTLAAGAYALAGGLEPFYIAPKLRVAHSPRSEVSVGTLIFFYDDEQVSIAYGVGTFGTPDHALTAGLGFGFSGAGFSNQPVAMIGAETRISAGMKLITENYFLPGETGVLFSGALRILGERFAADLGFAGGAGDGGPDCCLPIVNFSYAFGRGR